ncbi:MAG: TonB-dependent siderophore receptor [Caulobacteraceae bacterium]|nr:TonB-dependent siderophore receptor [Caulobacteraceae bacterium]
MTKPTRARADRARLLSILLASTAVAAASPVLAQQSEVQTTSVTDVDIYGHRDNGYRATATTTATKTPTALIDTPQAVTVVTRDQINDQALISMNDVVRYVPGASYAQGEGNRDTLVLRGISNTADFFTDGVRDDTQYYRDFYNIERVEILNGPNAMTFGRGGPGGVVNRVTRQAGWGVDSQLRVEAGSDSFYRGTGDYNHIVSDQLAVRLTGLYENSDSYRDGVEYEKFGLNPTATVRLGDGTMVQLGYEHFEDRRIADRGVPANAGGTLANPAKPLEGYTHTFFGDPRQSPTDTDIDAFSAMVEHRFSNGLTLRNRTRIADYDKFYQNVFPGAVNATTQTVAISGYNTATQRQNVFNQTDLIYKLQAGGMSHTLLAGAEFGRQETENLRQTAFFTGGVTTINAPLSNPTVSVPITWAQNATDASNKGTAKIAAAYVQDQIELTSQLQLLLGLRFDSFKVDTLNRRTNVTFSATDDLWSPRVGLVFKPAETLAFYGSYSKTYLPRSGEQLASLSATTAALKPEEFDNYELGAKWDVNPALSFTAAVYQLDRKNVVVPDPSNPAVSILVDGQRSRGVEIGGRGQITPEWSIVGAYTHIEAEITKAQSATVLAGNRLANVAEDSASLWNRYDFTPKFGAGLGVIYQGERFAASDNTQVLPAFTRVDAALYYAVNDKVDVQLNVENLFDEGYFASANSNNNITPGSPRAFRVALTSRF